MTEYLTEQEQIQQLKQLARQYIPAVLIGLILAFALTSAWRAWQNHQDTIRVLASTGYEDMLTADQQGKTADVTEDAKILFNQYPKTAYANLAALMLAQQAVTRGDLKEAALRLNAVLDRGKKTGLFAIASLRLARVKIADNDPEGALHVLDAIEDPAFSGLVNAIRGDALVAEKKPAAAAEAYRLALQTLPNEGMIKPLLQMKYDNLPLPTPGNNP